MSEESSAQEKVIRDGKGIFKFNNVNLEKERSELTLEKAHQNHFMRLFKNLLPKAPEYYQALLNIYENQEPIQDPDPCEDLILADFLTGLKQQPSKIGGKNCLEYIYDLRDKNSKKSKKVPQGIPDDFPNVALFSNGENYKKCKEENEKLIQGIKSIKENEMRNESQDDSFIQLTLDTIDEFGSNPYKDGTIAAQSMDSVKADVTLFWSVCGEGMFGRVNDVDYADLIANAIDAESMKQVRKDLGVNEIAAASSTKDELNAVSAFMALNAKGTVYIAAGSQCHLGQYLTEVELPILLRNPNVTSIELIDTSKPHFLENLKRIAEKYNSDAEFNLQEFQGEAKGLIDSAKREIFNRADKIITKENVEEFKQGVIDSIHLNKDIIKEKENISELIMLNDQWGFLKNRERYIDSLQGKLNSLEIEHNLQKDNENNLNKLIKKYDKDLKTKEPLAKKQKDSWKFMCDKAKSELPKLNDELKTCQDKISEISSKIQQLQNMNLSQQKEKIKTSLNENFKRQKPLRYIRTNHNIADLKKQRDPEKNDVESAKKPLSMLNKKIKEEREKRSQQKQPLTK